MDKVCGLDVHKDSVFACILDETGGKIREERFGTLTPRTGRSSRHFSEIWSR
ncbi:hypothetical protein EZS27_026461 [termite gut metagenome]|uniref:Uncharacterized protein n=1 Tax=termite gut metagenome TaxID=433724 RepID=A0A5J4QRK7_9ZZZZ